MCWPKDVGRRTHLKIVDEIVVRYQIGVPVLDNVAGIATEEQRFRRTPTCGVDRVEGKRWLHVPPQREDSLLWKVPSSLVECDIQLNGCGFVRAFDDRPRSTVVVHRRVGKRRPATGPKGKPFTRKPKGVACAQLLDEPSGKEGLMASRAEKVDRGFLGVSAGFGKTRPR